MLEISSSLFYIKTHKIKKMLEISSSLFYIKTHKIKKMKNKYIKRIYFIYIINNG